MHTNDFYCWKYKVGNCTHEQSYVLNFSAKRNLVPNRLWKLRLFRRSSNTNELVFDALALIISYTWKTDYGFSDRNEIRPIVIMKKIGRKFYIYVLDFIIIQISNCKNNRRSTGGFMKQDTIANCRNALYQILFYGVMIIYFILLFFLLFRKKAAGSFGCTGCSGWGS